MALIDQIIRATRTGEQVILTPESSRIATRLPTGKAATENPLTQNLLVGTHAMDAGGTLPKNLQLIGTNPAYNQRLTGGPLLNQAEDLAKQYRDNLLYLYDATPDEMHGQAKLWYDGANFLANQFAQKFGTKPEAAAGVMASLSPQKDWYQNVSLAERLMGAVRAAKKQGLTKEQKEVLTELYPGDKYKKDILAVKERSWDNLTDTQKAMWVRSYDKVNNPSRYRIVTPDGKFIDFAKTQGGENRKVAWGSNTEIGKAISVLENPSIENISSQMGSAHKVRNFYNNIIKPNDPYGDVTIDTHAVAAAHLEPFSGKSVPVSHNFGTLKGGANTSLTGAQGTYGIYSDAYRMAANELGILPRELQSITWEAVRGLFPAAYKNEANAQRIANIMNNYKTGQITLDQAQRMVTESAGGITLPSWFQRGKDITKMGGMSPSSFRSSAPVGVLSALLGGKYLKDRMMTPQEQAARVIKPNEESDMAKLVNKTLMESYDPSPDVGSIKGVANNPVSQGAASLGMTLQGVGKNMQDAGPLGWMAGTAVEDLGNISQRAGYGESKITDPGMAVLDLMALNPSLYLSRGVANAMKDKDRNSMLMRQIFGD